MSALILFILFLALPEHCRADEARPSLRVNATIAVPLDSRAGVISAGVLCLPRGVLRVGDFILDDRVLGEMIEDEILWHRRADFTAGKAIERLSVDLKHVDAKLCAKKWGAFGLGDTRSLSGTASFSFSISISFTDRASFVNESVIDVEIPGSSSLPASMILNDAVRRLAADILILASSQPIRRAGS